MNKDDALRKVVGLIAQAERGEPGERHAFQFKAIALRLKYGISDADLEAEKPNDPEQTFFGVRFGFYGLKIGPLMDSCRDAIKTALRRIGDDHVDELVHLHNDVKNLAATVVKQRDIAIKKAYEREIAYFTSGDRDWQADDPHVHRMAIDRIKGDLRRDTVEKIVGVTWSDLWRKQAEEDDIRQADENGDR